MRFLSPFHHVTPMLRYPSFSPLGQVSCRYFSSVQSFHSFGLDPRLVSGLQEMQMTSATGIQEQSIPMILSRCNVLCTAQTGTGKTLAYLIPVIEQVLRQETRNQTRQNNTKQHKVDDTDIPIARPSVLVLLPSRELALQVAAIAKQLAHSAKFASCTITSGEHKRRQQQKIARRLDVVIGTPGRVAKCIQERDVFLSRLNTIVIDEADTLFDAKMGFRNELDAVLKPIQASAAKRKERLQMILAAATMRSPIDQVLKKQFGDLHVVSDNNIHKTPTTIKEEFVRVGSESKHSALRDILRLHARHAAKTMIFCRHSASVRSTEHMLREHDFQDTVCLHGDMPAARRHDAIHAFTKNANINILVCTDLAARGLDFDSVKHVVIFDFPKTAIDYVHRAGRTGRAGKQGLVTSLVTKHDLALATSIENSKRNNSTIKELKCDSVLSSSAATVPLLLSNRQENQVRRGGPPIKRSGVGRGTKKLQRHKVRTFR